MKSLKKIFKNTQLLHVKKKKKRLRWTENYRLQLFLSSIYNLINMSLFFYYSWHLLPPQSSATTMRVSLPPRDPENCMSRDNYYIHYRISKATLLGFCSLSKVLLLPRGTDARDIQLFEAVSSSFQTSKINKLIPISFNTHVTWRWGR